MFERQRAKFGFYTDLATSSLGVTAFHLGRRLQGKTPPAEILRELADEINFSDLFVPAQAQDLVRQSSYSMGRNGQLFLEGLKLSSHSDQQIPKRINQHREVLVNGKNYRVEISQKMARRIAKAAHREGHDVPPYVQYRATRSDGGLTKTFETVAKYSALTLSWFVVGSAALAHLIESFGVQPITESCKPAVGVQDKKSLCYEWNQKEQAVSVWKKKTRDEINKNLPFYAPSFSYQKAQTISYSDVPNHPEALDSLTAYAVQAGCPTASAAKLRQTFDRMTGLATSDELKKALTASMVHGFVSSPKSECRAM